MTAEAPATVRLARDCDAAAAASLHVSGITDGFLPTLGQPFLSRLYRRMILAQHSFVLVADSGDAVVGFVAGTESLGRLYRAFMLRDGLMAAASAAPRLIAAWRQVLETAWYGTRGSAGDLPTAELVAIVVADRARGKGVGRMLVRACQSELAGRGPGAVKVVVGSDNHGAIAMYRECGFEPATALSLHGRAISEVLVWTPS